jgi:hypothetical protein
MRRRYHAHAYAGVVSALLIACTDPVVEPVDDGDELLTSTGEVSLVARGFALALASPQMRAMIRDAMRASELNEHKLVLQDFADTPEGRQLLAAAARELGVSDTRLVRIVKGLPEFDFYVPLAKHRREWRATSDVLVAATSDPENRYLDAYSTDGAAVRLDYEDGTPPRALLILHPGEKKWRRTLPHPSLSGKTIEDPDERGPHGDGMPPHSVGFSPDSVYIDEFGFGAGDGWGDSELRFEASLRRNSQTIATGRYEQGNVEQGERYDITAPLIHVAPQAYSNDTLWVELWEDDCCGGDDYYGFVRVIYNERRVEKCYHCIELTASVIRLDWFDGTNRHPSTLSITPSTLTVAAGATAELTLFVHDQTGALMQPSQHAAPTWQSMNSGVATVSSSGRVTGVTPGSTTIKVTVCPTPFTSSPGSPCKQGSVPVTVYNGPASLTASISGPSSVGPNEMCAWWAGAFGGTGSYTYNWYVNGAWQSSNYDMYYTNSGSSFTIELQVRDSNGATGSASQFVSVSSSEGPCPS